MTEAHAKARKQFKKDKLRWRVSGGSRRSLGWIPFKSGAAVWKDGQVRYNGHFFKVWDSYKFAQYTFRSGSFTEDARGRWYFNVVVQVQATELSGKGAVGIDLGLKDTATCSNGLKLESKQFYRKAEKQLGMAQRANKKKRIKAIHAKRVRVAGSVSVNSPKGRAGLGIREWTCPDCGLCMTEMSTPAL